MKIKQLRAGDLIEVATVDRALGGKARERRPRRLRKERWRAAVIGPSVMGDGWWIVKKIAGRGSTRRTYTVPEVEVVRVVVRAA